MCPQGTYANLATNACDTITDGYGSMLTHLVPMKCTYGYYSDSTTIVANGAMDCQLCDNGEICGSAEVTKNPLTCPEGFYCNPRDEFSGQYTKYPCPPGTYKNGATG